jgi:tetratricopeptide (TPR) repeat protein
VLGELQRHADALTAFDRSLALEKNDPVVWFNKGTALQMLGRHREALAAINRVLALSPHDEKVQRMKNDLIRLLRQK